MPKTAKIAAPSRAKVPAGAKRSKQIGAFCYRLSDSGKVKFLLVTSSNGRWILPKGWPMPGESSRTVAEIEAWEEAGVRKAKSSKKPAVAYKSVKHIGPASRIKTKVAVHTLKVKTLAKGYPEDDKRSRRWVTLKQALKLVKDKRLRKALTELTDQVKPAAALLPKT